MLEVAAERARALVVADWAIARIYGPPVQEHRAGPVAGELARHVELFGSAGRLLGELLLRPDTSAGGVEAQAVLTQLGQVTATRLENAMLFEREHHVAETLQRSLLPESLPELRDAELSAIYLPGLDGGERRRRLVRRVRASASTPPRS